MVLGFRLGLNACHLCNGSLAFFHCETILLKYIESGRKGQ